MSGRKICTYLLLALLFLPGLSGSNNCPGNFLLKGAVCYSFSRLAKTYDQAVLACRELGVGAILAEPRSEAENRHLSDFAMSYNPVILNIVVGITDSQEEGVFRYNSTGQVVKYKNWKNGDPYDNNGQNCVEITITKPGDSGYEWDDYVCSEDHRYVCQIKPGTTTTIAQDTTVNSIGLFGNETDDNVTDSVVVTNGTNINYVIGPDGGNQTNLDLPLSTAGRTTTTGITDEKTRTAARTVERSTAAAIAAERTTTAPNTDERTTTAVNTAEKTTTAVNTDEITTTTANTAEITTSAATTAERTTATKVTAEILDQTNPSDIKETIRHLSDSIGSTIADEGFNSRIFLDKIQSLIATIEVSKTSRVFTLISDNLAIAAMNTSDISEDRAIFLSSKTGPGQKFLKNEFSLAFTPSNQTISQEDVGVEMMLPLDANNHLSKRVIFAVHSISKIFDLAENVSSKSTKSPIVNSVVLFVSFPASLSVKLRENITIRFKHKYENGTKNQCVYWKKSPSPLHWSTDGCTVTTTSIKHTTCSCNHLTNFCLLMPGYIQDLRDDKGEETSVTDKKALSIISTIGCLLSVLGTLLTVIVFASNKILFKITANKILINLCISILCVNLFFLSGEQEYTYGNEIGCKVVAAGLQYFLLASMFWMIIDATNLYFKVCRAFDSHINNFLLKSLFFGWGVPLLVVTVTLAVDTENYGYRVSGDNHCWLSTQALYVTFVTPVVLTLIFNTVVFICVIKQMHTGSASLGTSRFTYAERLRAAIGLIVLLGLTWVFGFISQTSVVFMYLFEGFNSLQGFFIFIYYCLLNKTAREFLTQCCRRQRNLANTGKSKTKTENQTSPKPENKNVQIENKETAKPSATETEKTKDKGKINRYSFFSRKSIKGSFFSRKSCKIEENKNIANMPSDHNHEQTDWQPDDINNEDPELADPIPLAASNSAEPPTTRKSLKQLGQNMKLSPTAIRSPDENT